MTNSTIAPAESVVLTVRLARNSREIEQAMRLRYQVFVEEAGNARLAHPSRLEHDAYDEDCDHLIARDENSGAVVGTYRLLPGARALDRRGFYSETEFDLSAFSARRAGVLELGRSCVAAPFRGTRVIQQLWGGIAAYIAEHGQTHLIGCASLPDGQGAKASEIYSLLKRHGVLTERYGVRPLESHRIHGLRELPVELGEREMLRRLPPLLKGYRWMGAEIAGPPAYDPLFATTDFFVVFEAGQMASRYRRHFASSYQVG